MCNGAMAHFTVINRVVAHCFKKVGHPGYRIFHNINYTCITSFWSLKFVIKLNVLATRWLRNKGRGV